MKATKTRRRRFARVVRGQLALYLSTLTPDLERHLDQTGRDVADIRLTALRTAQWHLAELIELERQSQK